MKTNPVSRNARNAFLLGWVLFWLLMIAVALQDYRRDGGTQYWQPLLWEGTSALVSSLLLWVFVRVDRGSQTLLTQPRQWFWRHLRLLPIVCLGFVALTFSLRHAVYASMGQTYTHEGWVEVLLYESLKLALYYGMFLAVVFGLRSYLALVQDREKLAEAQALARQAQLLQLTQQVQPHFLFNALNTVSALMHSDVERADHMLSQLALVLRANLDVGEQMQTTLQQDLHILQAYASLMGERFSDRVEIHWNIADAALNCLVPLMGWQILLENVFKHTVEKRAQKVTIRLSAQIHDNQLHLSVADDGGHLAQDWQAGVGLSNLRMRLASFYGESAKLELNALQPVGVHAEMRLPCVY